MSIMSMISCARRELRMREAYYPERVRRGVMSPEKAQHEIDAMRAICELLDSIQERQAAEVQNG